MRTSSRSAGFTTSRTRWQLRRQRILARAKLDRHRAQPCEHFPGSSTGLEFVRERNGVQYYNDSKATNVDATEKAIDAFPGKLVDHSRRQGQE